MESLVVQTAAAFVDKRVLVTGAGGFIGCRLVAALVTAGAHVSILESPSADIAPLRELISHVGHYSVDIRDQTAVHQAVHASRPEYVFHLAAVGVTDPFLSLELALDVNLQGAINLFRACFDGKGRFKPARLVHTGTPYEFGGDRGEPDPISPYAASKAAAFAVARMYHRMAGWPIVTVRPFQVYGPGQSPRALIPAAIQAVRAGRTFRMTGGEQKRDFVYVDDVVRGFLLAALKGVDGRSYELGWGEALSTRAVMEKLYRRILRVEESPEYGALPYRPGEIWDLAADVGLAVEDLGWRPQVSLERGLWLTVQSLQGSGSTPAGFLAS